MIVKYYVRVLLPAKKGLDNQIILIIGLIGTSFLFVEFGKSHLMQRACHVCIIFATRVDKTQQKISVF